VEFPYEKQPQCIADPTKNYSLSLYVKCNKNIKKENAVPKLISENPCEYQILLEVDRGCPIVSLSVLLSFITVHTPLFSVGFIVLGLALGIYGRSMWPTVIFGLVAFSVTILGMIIMYEYVLPFNVEVWILWISFLGSTIVGMVVACFVAKHDWIGFVLLGAWLGATSTLFLSNIYARVVAGVFVGYKTWNQNRVMGLIAGAALIVIPFAYTYVFNEITFWICFAAITAVCAYSAFAIKDLLITIATSFLGSYLAVRVFSYLLTKIGSVIDFRRIS